MSDKNKIRLLIAAIVILAILYVIFTVLKFFVSVTLKVVWIGFIVVLVIALFNKLTNRK